MEGDGRQAGPKLLTSPPLLSSAAAHASAFLRALNGQSATSCQPGPARCAGPLFFLVSALWENRVPTQQN